MLPCWTHNINFEGVAVASDPQTVPSVSKLVLALRFMKKALFSILSGGSSSGVTFHCCFRADGATRPLADTAEHCSIFKRLLLQ